MSTNGDTLSDNQKYDFLIQRLRKLQESLSEGVQAVLKNESDQIKCYLSDVVIV